MDDRDCAQIEQRLRDSRLLSRDDDAGSVVTLESDCGEKAARKPRQLVLLTS